MSELDLARQAFAHALSDLKKCIPQERAYYGHLVRQARWKMERLERVVIREPMPHGRNGK